MAFRIGSMLRGPLWGCRGFRTSCGTYKIVQFVLSDIGEGIREVTVRDWFVKVGDRVKQFDDICLVESDKAAVNITSRFDGVVTKIYHQEGDLALVGQPLVDIDSEGQEEASDVGERGTAAHPTAIPEAKPPTPAAEEQRKDNSWSLDLESIDSAASKALATPAVRRIAKEYKIPLSDVRGSGKSGRVMKEDVIKYLDSKTSRESVSSSDAKQVDKPSSREPLQRLECDKTVSITGIKKVMARTMTESNAIPSFGYSDELDVTKLVALRKEIRSQLQAGGNNITYMPFFIKALSNALVSYPELNSHVDSKCENMIIKAEHNIGLAVDTPNGLLVPNMKNVERMSLLEVSVELGKLVEKAKTRTLSIQDLTGGTITISNIGIIGGTYVRPLINPPEVAIVGLGRFRKRPVFDANDQIVAATTCNASWSADHRVIDGATLARFSELWKHFIENPLQLLLVK
uniref:Dihydrolipoamide acetyltransferase component of pyruvate dehydrogenase complex n=2 Tax=Lygus hesperus TaxID=30085 RepID=A0A0A9WWW1_LYGHE